jgi:hypothetical protein
MKGGEMPETTGRRIIEIPSCVPQGPCDRRRFDEPHEDGRKLAKTL